MVIYLLNKMNNPCEFCKTDDYLELNYEKGIIVCRKCGTVQPGNITDNEIIQPIRQEQENEPGTYLSINRNGIRKKILIYSKRSKICKNKKKLNKLLSSASPEIKENLIEKTKSLYEDLAKRKNMQGMKITHIIIALYYYACKKEKMAKSYKEVAKMFPSITERQIRRAFNWIKRDIVISEDEEGLIKIENNFVDLYTGINIKNYELRMLSHEIIENINHKCFLQGKSPNTIAGLALMLSYKLLNDNSDDFEEFFVTFSKKNTIIRAFKEIKEQLENIIPVKYAHKIGELKLNGII